MNAAVDEDSALLQFPKEFENAETLLISEVMKERTRHLVCTTSLTFVVFTFR